MRLTDKFENLPGIYIIRCAINGKYYVGESINIQKRITRHRYCKEQLISKAINKHGIENFTVEVYYFENFNKKDLLDLEEEIILKYDSVIPNGYNILSRGMDFSGRVFSEEHKKKLSNIKKGVPLTEEHRNNISKAGMGRVVSDSTKMKISKGNKGRKHSIRSRKNMSVGSMNKKVSLETREKISKGNKGKIVSDETKYKMSLSQKGRIISDETRKKMSEARNKFLKSKS